MWKVEETQMETIDIKKMRTTERLQIMDTLWDSLLYEETKIESQNGTVTFSKKENEKSKAEKQNFSLSKS